MAIVKEVSLKLQGADPYGQVESGWLLLEAPFSTLTYLFPNSSLSQTSLPFELFVGHLFEDTVGFAAYEFELQHRPEPTQHIAAVTITRTSYEERGKTIQCIQLLFLESTTWSRVTRASVWLYIDGWGLQLSARSQKYPQAHTHSLINMGLRV